MAELLDKLKDTVGGVSAPDLSGAAIMNHPVWSKLAFFGRIAFYIVLFGGACILFYKLFLEYNKKVTVMLRLGGGGVETKSTRGKVITDEQGKTKLQLWMKVGKKTLSCPVPPSSFKSKEGRSDRYFLWCDDNAELHPMMPPHMDDENFVYRLKIRPQERDAWARYEQKRLMEKFQKKDLWEKYMPTVVVISAFLVAFLIFFFMSKDLAGGLASLSGQFAQVASSCTSLGG